MAEAAAHVKTIVAHYVRALMRQNVRPVRVVLFGSHARGNAAAWSDIDVSIISADLAGKGILDRQRILGRANQDLQAPIDVVGYTPEEWADAEAGTLLGEIRRTGVPLTPSELGVESST